MTDISDRQRRIAECIAIGLSDKQIAARESIALDTVTYHVSQIARVWALDTTRNVRVMITRAMLASAA